MSDEMDVFLGRSLKNWASRHAPLTSSRRLLLQHAHSFELISPRHWYTNLWEQWNNRLAPPVEAMNPHSEWFTEPISQLATWYLHVSVSTRLAS